MQPRRPQVHRPRPHSHQCKSALATPYLLQGQEVHAARSPPKADTCHAQTVNEGGGEPCHRQAEEEAETFSTEELCG